MAEQQERSTSPEMSAADIEAILDSFEVQSEGPESEEAEEDPVVAPMDVQICAGAPNATPTPTSARGCTNRGCATC